MTRPPDPSKAALFAVVAVVVLGLNPLFAAGAEDTSLSLADLGPYRLALETPSTTPAPARAVTFRDLWDHAATYQGERVQVVGRVVRRFRQGALGTFPPLTEIWAVNPAGDPFCLVFPTSETADAAPGSSVRFAGTYLRRLRYQGGDTARLAPLIVGHAPPTITIPAPLKKALPSIDFSVGLSDGSWTRYEWGIALFLAALIGLMLARRHLRRPTRSQPEDDPAPEFVDRMS